jgi:hypothetical protein
MPDGFPDDLNSFRDADCAVIREGSWILPVASRVNTNRQLGPSAQSQRQSDTSLLEAAVAAYREALKDWLGLARTGFASSAKNKLSRRVVPQTGSGSETAVFAPPVRVYWPKSRY